MGVPPFVHVFAMTTVLNGGISMGGACASPAAPRYQPRSENGFRISRDAGSSKDMA